MPNNEIRFHFGAHATLEDALETGNDFQWCTVYCPEQAGHNDLTRQLYWYLSAGAIGPLKVFKSEKPTGPIFKLEQYFMIHGSRKRIELIDVPHNSPISDRLSKLKDAVVSVAEEDHSFSEARAKYLTGLVHFVLANRDRERHIIERLMHLDDELTNQRILVRLGTCHADIAHLARMMGLCVQTYVQRRPLEPLSLGYICVNRSKPMPHGLPEQCLFGQLLSEHTFLDNTVSDYHENNEVLWQTTKQFGISEIEDLWERCREDEQSAFSTLLEALRRKNLA